MQTSSMPLTGFLRLAQIVPAIIPIGKTSWWAGVKSGRYPAPVKLSPRVTVWRVEDIRALIAAPVGGE
jgi:prophage regulatory protein